MAYISNQIEELASYFKDPLKEANFDCYIVHKEWRKFKNLARSHFSGLDGHSLWEEKLIYKRIEFKNVYLMVEIVVSLSASNSTVEKAFNLSKLRLLDKRLSLKHETIKNLIKIKLSDKIWTEKEKNIILVYLSKRRGKKIAEPVSRTERRISYRA